MKKGFSGRGVPIRCETDPSSGAAGSTVDQNRAKPCRKRLFGLHRELESERQNGNPGLDHKCHFAELCPAIQGLRALIRK